MTNGKEDRLGQGTTAATNFFFQFILISCLLKKYRRNVLGEIYI